MKLQEFKRCWKSKLNILIAVFMSIPIIVAIGEDIYYRNWLINFIDEVAAQGYDITWYQGQLEGMNGLYLFERLFIAHTGTVFFSYVVFVIGVGINISANLFSALKTGYGITIVTRMLYKQYLFNTILAQFLYIVTYLASIFLIILTILLILGGGAIQTPGMSALSFDGEMALPLYLLTLFLFTIYVIICKAILILVASLSYVYLKNKYIIQSLPVAFFVGVYVIAFLIGSINDTFATITTALIYEQAHFSLVSLFSHVHSSGNRDIIYAAAYPLLLFGIMFLFYKQNIKKYCRDYLA